LSDSTRATFFWPHPGQPLNPDELFPDAIGPAAGPPATFEVLIIRPDQVEHLDLNPHPHRRRRWRRQTNWELENLNP
jgi:pyridoxamine 5'-phosphate oxidase